MTFSDDLLCALRAARVTAVLFAGLAGAGASLEAQAADRVLDQMTIGAGSVVVQFSCPMSFVSNFPLRTGDEIRIELQPLPGCAPPTSFGETLPVASDNPAGLVDVRLDQSLGARRSLILHFSRAVDFLIKPRAGLTGIEIVLSRRVGRADVSEAPPPHRASRDPSRTLPPQEELDRQLADARAAMQDRDYDAAIRLYTKLLEYPEHAGRPPAQEFLGLAHERKGELALAKAEYQEYLRRYPDGADLEAVQQRLAAIVTLEGATKPTRNAPDNRWHVNGAVAQDYRHDVNTIVSNGATANGIGQSSLDSEGDLQIDRRGSRYDFKSRVFAGYIRDMSNVLGAQTGIVQVPQAYIEVDDRQGNWLGRLGRQSQSTGGVYGSYDGAFVDWMIKPGFKLGVAAGAPIQTFSAGPKTDRVFANLAAEFPGVVPGLDLTGFVFEEKARGVLDSRQVGAEARYYRNGRSLVAQVDYDIYFKALNSATLLANWALPGHWNLTSVLDHRHTPFFATYNALIGQPTNSLTDLIATTPGGIDAVLQLARDRTATADTVTLGIQHPLGEQLQWSSDVSMGRVTGTPASGGVAATPASGTALSVSTSLLGGGWIMDGDMNTVGVSYSTRSSTKSIASFASARYPVNDKLRIGPRLTLAHTSGSDPAIGISSGWSLSPSLLADWRVGRGQIQLESGYEAANLNSSLLSGVPISPTPVPSTVVDQRTKRFWFSVGYTYSF